MSNPDIRYLKTCIIQSIMQVARLLSFGSYVDPDGNNMLISLNDIDDYAEMYKSKAVRDAQTILRLQTSEALEYEEE